MIIKNGAIANGAPLGKNKAKKWKPCLRIPIKLIKPKAQKANKKVKIIWLVVVYVYGIKPNKLLNTYLAQKNVNPSKTDPTKHNDEPFISKIDEKISKKVHKSEAEK